MNTNKLKIFAAQARNILIKGVIQRMEFWAFNENGEADDKPETVEGGYIFRDNIFNDPSVPDKWKQLQKAIETHGYNDVIEQAGYTWFNRLMAIRILEKNNYEQPVVQYLSELDKTPKLLIDARSGQMPKLNKTEQLILPPLLNDYTKEEEAFAVLIKAYSREHSLISKVFGRIYDYTELLLPGNLLENNGILDLLNFSDSISDEDYQQVELIGWLYQFYISEKKDEVFKKFKSKKKAEAEDIPAATQIFTPRWIVRYMCENTIGRQWLDLNPDSNLRQKMKYLVETDNENTTRKPIITEASDLNLLDPACGSGHILVEAFDMMFAMFREEGYSKREAVEHILEKNLFGLDIDLRAVQLARFAVLLKAASHHRDILKSQMIPQIYAMPEKATFSRQEMIDFLGEDFDDYEILFKSFLRQMEDAQNIGSALKLSINDKVAQSFYQRLEELLNSNDKEQTTLAKKVRYHIMPALLLTRKYKAVAANPPYMGQGNMNAELKKYINKHYPLSKSDLFAVFMEAFPYFLEKNGLWGFITPPSWLFLSTYEKLRKYLLKYYKIDSLLHLSRGVFGADFGSVSVVFKKEENEKATGNYFRLVERTFQEFHQYDLEKLFLASLKDKDFKYNFSEYEKSKPINIKSSEKGNIIFYPQIPQTNFSKIPGSPIAYWVSEKIVKIFENGISLEKLTISDGQNVTGNNDKFVRKFWEVNSSSIGKSNKYLLYAKGGSTRKWYGNIIDIIDWSEETRIHFRKNKICRILPEYLWYKKGITWNLISSTIPCFRELPEISTFDKGGSSIFLIKDENFDYIIPLLNSKLSIDFFKIFNSTFNLQVKDVRSIPVNNLIFENINIKKIHEKLNKISRLDWDSRETSWDFEENPLIKYQAENLEKSYWNWEKAVTEDFMQLHQNEEELNRIFIEIYDLADELTPDVPLKDITILQEEIDRKKLAANETQILQTYRQRGWQKNILPINAKTVMEQFISYTIGCFMGRYHLGKKGLHIAHPNPTKEELQNYILPENFAEAGTSFEIDGDGIVPLMEKEAAFADNASLRFRQFVQHIWGEASLTQNLNFIESALGKNIDTYLMKDFAKYHYRNYKKRPIYWLFRSSKGTFQVLAYLHRMNKYTAQKVRMNYLLKFIEGLRTQIEQLKKDDNRSTAEQKQLEKLEKQYLECRDYDTQLEEIARRQIDFDLDDGVKVNYAKFGKVLMKL